MVRVVLRGLPGGTIDVSRDHVPVSLRPLVLGVRVEIRDDPPAASTRLALDFYDSVENRRPLANIGLSAIGVLPMARGELQLYRTTYSRNTTAPPLVRWARYASAWRHARRARSRGDRLQMSANDLRCLNAYYMAPRPVYLVSVEHAGRVNVFPMDLVGSVASGEFLLALRATSPSIELIERSRRVVMSAAPASLLRAVYDLGGQHRLQSIDAAALPFGVRSSSAFHLPVLAEDGLVREVSVRQVHRIGSHVLFVGAIEGETGHTRDRLAHMSSMYAEWLKRMGRAQRSLA
jgi:flavin reductase (DIM6/NTAB) family NADH-FMN oxidoreductase RutF